MKIEVAVEGDLTNTTTTTTTNNNSTTNSNSNSRWKKKHGKQINKQITNGWEWILGVYKVQEETTFENYVKALIQKNRSKGRERERE